LNACWATSIEISIAKRLKMNRWIYRATQTLIFLSVNVWIFYLITVNKYLYLKYRNYFVVIRHKRKTELYRNPCWIKCSLLSCSKIFSLIKWLNVPKFLSLCNSLFYFTNTRFSLVCSNVQCDVKGWESSYKLQPWEGQIFWQDEWTDMQCKEVPQSVFLSQSEGSEAQGLRISRSCLKRNL
jgi:hypothetical protein